jgi:hypothetical protein
MLILAFLRQAGTHCRVTARIRSENHFGSSPFPEVQFFLSRNAKLIASRRSVVKRNLDFH